MRNGKPAIRAGVKEIQRVYGKELEGEFMRVLISADAEGITGIFKKSQVTPGRPEYNHFRSLMAHDVNAAIWGAFEGGATEVIVNDSHNNDDNILLTELDPRASLMSGTDKPLIMAEGLQSGVDALMLVGYHSRKGARGVISHTYYYPIVIDAEVNGVSFGEAEFVAGVAGYYGIPTILITGDDCVTTYIKKQIPDIHTAVVKRVIGNGSAELYHPEKTGEQIRAEAKAAVSDYQSIRPMKLEGPLTLTITFMAATMAAHACKVAGFSLAEDQENKVIFQCDDYLELYRAFLDALWQAAAFNDQC